MRLRNWTSVPLPETSDSFEMIREVTAVAATSTPAAEKTRSLFAAAHLHCQRGGAVKTGEECLACSRIVSLRPSEGRRTITIRCLWTDRDPVSAVMTLTARILHVNRDASIGEADAIARGEDVHHLLVVDHNDVIGSICVCALKAGPGTVADRMIPHVWIIPATATLGQAAQAMIDLEAGLLVVADRGVVLGAITAGDLGLGPTPHAH
jgi:CBS domain-containing protein